MAIQKEIWTKYIAENLFKDNEFLNYAFNADQYVLEGKVVHIPNAGVTANIVKNRTVLPATVIQRADIDITFRLMNSRLIQFLFLTPIRLSYPMTNSPTC